MATLRRMRLVESLAEVLRPGAKSSVYIAPLLEGFEAAEESAAALAGHEGHLHLSRRRVAHLAFDRDSSDLQSRGQHTCAWHGKDSVGRHGLTSGHHRIGLADIWLDVCDGEAQHHDALTGVGYEIVVTGLEFVPNGFGEIVRELSLVFRVDVPLLDFRDEEDLDRIHQEVVRPFQGVWILEIDQPIRVPRIGLELRISIIPQEA